MLSSYVSHKSFSDVALESKIADLDHEELPRMSQPARLQPGKRLLTASLYSQGTQHQDRR